MYPTYTAVLMKHVLGLAERYGVNVEGMLSWSFEFEGQPYFDGFRSLATNGIGKPVLNLFRMAGLMNGELVGVESTGAAGIDRILASGIGGNGDIDALATRTTQSVAILLWNYHDDDVPAPAAAVRVQVAALPREARALLTHYRIDRDHSNAYTLWKNIGSPQQPSPQQYSLLEAAGQLQLMESPRWVAARQGTIDIDMNLPRHSVSLLLASW